MLSRLLIANASGQTLVEYMGQLFLKQGRLLIVDIENSSPQSLQRDLTYP